MGGQETILGAIDAGSNALRVVIARVDETDGLVPMERLRLPVRLGHNAFTRGELESATVDAAVGAFSEFRALFDKHGVSQYRAVATSALRNSRNREIVQHRVYHETGIELEVISGEEEARLIRKAVKHAFRRRSAPMTILDLGGGSFEVNVRTGSRWRAASLPIGTVRLVELFGITGAIGPDEEGMVRRYVDTLLRTFIQADFSRDFSPVVACGGNAEAFAALLGPADEDVPSFTAADLTSELRDLCTRYGAIGPT
jgi:exopolyphosphatase/guanosine-5'-triphosphate,3'-diphosphate pyrophosphatase